MSLELLRHRRIDGVYFASITAPYAERQSASTIVAALDFGKELLTADFANSVRTSTLDEGLDTEKPLVNGVLASEDAKEGTTAFAARRKPVYKGR